ncbi:MAG: hypothetical protein IJI36_06945 [Kiritimatiellae bacterium]|nr:hypothetical protein [Kiritimatiellia bacterium]MBQ6338865.1 hypothetical protein [Kiritimatiellia bacterium]
MKSRSIFSAIITVAALSASADVLNVEVLDLDAPREEPPTVVPTRPPDDPEPVNEPYERPTLPGSEEVTNRVAEALLFRAWGAVVDYFDSVDENGVEYTTQLVIPTWTWEGFLGEDETNGVTRAAKKASFDWYLGHLATNCCANFSDDQTNYVRIALNECRDLKYTNAWQSLKGIALNSSAPYRGYAGELYEQYGPLDDFMTDFCLDVETNAVQMTFEERGDIVGEYTSRLHSLPPGSNVRQRGVAGLYANRLSDCSRAIPVDELLVASMPGYEFSTNRLAAALYVLSCTNSWSEQNAYFIGVTNAIENALNNPCLDVNNVNKCSGAGTGIHRCRHIVYTRVTVASYDRLVFEE